MNFDIGNLFIFVVETIVEIISAIFDWILSKLGFKTRQIEKIKKWTALIILTLFLIGLVWITIILS